MSAPNAVRALPIQRDRPGACDSDNLLGNGHLPSIGARFQRGICPVLPSDTAAKLRQLAYSGDRSSDDGTGLPPKLRRNYGGLGLTERIGVTTQPDRVGERARHVLPGTPSIKGRRVRSRNVTPMLVILPVLWFCRVPAPELSQMRPIHVENRARLPWTIIALYSLRTPLPKLPWPHIANRPSPPVC